MEVICSTIFLLPYDYSTFRCLRGTPRDFYAKDTILYTKSCGLSRRGIKETSIYSGSASLKKYFQTGSSVPWQTARLPLRQLGPSETSASG